MLILPPNASRKAKAARSATKGLREVLICYRAEMEDALRAEGLTLPQLRMLYAVAEHPEVSAAALARLCQITPQTVQIMLARAEREGWISRTTSKRNQRIITTALTMQGETLLQRGNVMAAQIEAKLWKGISLDSLEKFNGLLQQGIRNLQTG